MANKIPLKIVWFKNPSGESVPRVTGTIRGERIRQNFKTEADAQIFINERIGNLLSAKTPKPLITSLSETEARQAEAAIALLPKGTDLIQAATYFAQYHRPLVPLPFKDAVEAWGDWLVDQRKNEEATKKSRTGFLLQFGKEKKILRSDRISIDAAKEWIYEKSLSDRTQRDRFDLLNQFCGWLSKSQQKHAASNPVAELDRPVVKIDAPGVLSFAQTRDLLQCALTDPEGPDMLPFFALCCLSGVRPDEVPRLTWDDIHLEKEHQIIEINKAKGGRRRRNAEICKPLLRILAWAKKKKLAPGFYSRRKFDRIRRDAGVFDIWEKDILRHTYASHHYILHKDIKRLISNMGNSEDVLFQHYVRPVPLAESKMLFDLNLDRMAPARPSNEGKRTDRLMVRPLASMRPDEVAMLRTLLAARIARIDRRVKRGGAATGRPALEAKLAEVQRALHHQTEVSGGTL